jgi:outer membrane PBP1 activator LpoA protein
MDKSRHILNQLKLASILLSVFILSSCATKVEKVVTAPITKVEKPSKELVLSNAELSLQRAEEQWQRNGDINQRNQLLLEAAQDFQTGEQCVRSDIIVANIEPFLTKPFQKQYATLLKAECSLIQHYASGSSVELLKTPIDTMISWLSTINEPAFTNRKEVLIAHVAALHQRWDLASSVLAQQLNADSPLNNAPEHNLWEWFLKSSKQNKQTLANQNGLMQAYYSLANIIEDEALNDVSRQQAISFWQERHPSHPLSVELPIDIRRYMEQSITKVEKIAVLLPLSGRVQAQGDAIKQGIMSAFFYRLQDIQQNNPGAPIPQLTFIDTGSDSTRFKSDEINAESLGQYDVIIGPLLRDHVNMIKDLRLPESMFVYLNRTNNQDRGEMEETGVAKVYFALAPEDEAIQLANLMHSKQVETPILISNDSSISRRMIDAFNQQWLALNSVGTDDPFAATRLPKIVTFTDNKSLRIGITDALDVLQSQQRISQMSRLSSEVVHSVTRNRRDVDAFVVFAQPQEVELLNPIIEASISLFTEDTLPVFATSYSYQHQLNKNSIRDLRNLVFVDMPFLMPEQRRQALAKEVDSIWNNPPSTFLRLFAFGFDAFQFSEQMQQLAFFSHTELSGMSGKLSVNADREVVRQLPSALIAEEDITQTNAL